VLALAIAALTLQFCGYDGFGERQGINGRYAPLGTAFAAAMLGGVAYFSADAAVFVFTAFLTIPALLMLTVFRVSDQVVNSRAATHHPRERRRRAHRPWDVLRAGAPGVRRQRRAVLFCQRGDAATGTQRVGEAHRVGELRRLGSHCRATGGRGGVFTLGGSPGRKTGRRPVLLVGFAALPLRGLVFAASPDPYLLVAVRLLDGISGPCSG